MAVGPALEPRFEEWLAERTWQDFEALAKDVVVEELCQVAGPGSAFGTETREGVNDGGYDFYYRGPYAGDTRDWRGSIKKTAVNGTHAERRSALKQRVKKDLDRYQGEHWLLVTSLALTPDDRRDLQVYARSHRAAALHVIDRAELLSWGLKHPWILHRHGFDAGSALRDWPRQGSGLEKISTEPLPEPWEQIAQELASDGTTSRRRALSPRGPATFVLARAAHVLRRQDILTLKGLQAGENLARLERDLPLLDPDRTVLVLSERPPRNLDPGLNRLHALEIYGAMANIPAGLDTLPIPRLTQEASIRWTLERFRRLPVQTLESAWQLAADDPAEAALLLLGQSDLLELSLSEVLSLTNHPKRALRLLFALAMQGAIDPRAPPMDRLAEVAGLSVEAASELFDALADTVLWERPVPPLRDLDGRDVPDSEPHAYLNLRPVVGLLVGREQIPSPIRPYLAEPPQAIHFAKSTGNIGPIQSLLADWTSNLDAAQRLPPALSTLVQHRVLFSELHPAFFDLLERRIALAEDGAPLSHSERWSIRALVETLVASDSIEAPQVVSLLKRLFGLSERDAEVFRLLESNKVRAPAPRMRELFVALAHDHDHLGASMSRTLPDVCSWWLGPNLVSSGQVGGVGIFSTRFHHDETRPTIAAAGDLLVALVDARDGPTRARAWRAAGSIWREPSAPPVYLNEIVELVHLLAAQANRVLSSPLPPERWVEWAEVERAVLWFATLRTYDDSSPVLPQEDLALLLASFPRDPTYLLYRALFHNDGLVIDPIALAELARSEPLDPDAIRRSCARVGPVRNDADFAAAIARSVAAAVQHPADLVERLTKLGLARTSQDPLRGLGLRGELAPTTLTMMIEHRAQIAWELIVSRDFEDLPASIREIFLIAAKAVFRGHLDGQDAVDGRSARQNMRLRAVLGDPSSAPVADLQEMLDFALELLAPAQRGALLFKAAAHPTSEGRAVVTASTLRWANGDPSPDSRDVAAILATLSEADPEASPTLKTAVGIALSALHLSDGRLTEHWRAILRELQHRVGKERVRGAIDRSEAEQFDRALQQDSEVRSLKPKELG